MQFDMAIRGPVTTRIAAGLRGMATVGLSSSRARATNLRVASLISPMTSVKNAEDRNDDRDVQAAADERLRVTARHYQPYMGG
jgi:hypothetical protein